MITRIAQRKRPRRPAFLLIAAASVAALLFSAVALALVTDSGDPVDVQVVDKFSSVIDEQTDAGAFISYFGDGDTTFGSSGTGTFDPFVRLQGSPTEEGYNTDGKVQFDTKKGTWTHAILVSEIPQRPCPGPEDDPDNAPPPPPLLSLTCFELWVDINESNNAKHVSLNEVEIYYASGGTGNPPPASLLVGYPFDSPTTPAGLTVTKEYDFSGSILIHDVNQGSGRGDLRYNVPIGTATNQVPLPANCNYGNPACTTYFVLYSEWGTQADIGDIDYGSEGGFEEWKVRIYPTPPDVQVVKTPDATTTINAGTDAVFTIVVTNNGPIAATNVTLTDTLPNSGLSWTVGGPDAAACSITTGVLTCNFGTIGFPTLNTRTITLTSATDAADCTRSGGTGNIDNTALVSASNEDPGASGNNSDSGQITVSCAAIQILKQSTKTGNPLVTDPTPLVTTDNAVFTITPPVGAAFAVTDNGTGDQDTTYGEVCVSGLASGTYTVTETTAPAGYASGNPGFDASASAVAGTDCNSNHPSTANSAIFRNAPLGEFIIDFNDLGSGETSAKIDCTTPSLTPTPADGTPTLYDDNIETYTNLPGADPAIVYTCTISIDP